MVYIKYGVCKEIGGGISGIIAAKGQEPQTISPIN